ncbi:MFS transporter [Spelaeicoccus albus]|uniref:MFS family permease n=1 Tax=Spelaeicoccus albus TaxID=1280376 RepID=A0A7Z0IJ05_9MICO|nr:MFS transporter [Spelaeicoccus albus]NYI69050.1 MFS family permease [Spelaeicoccus albus]
MTIRRTQPTTRAWLGAVFIAFILSGFGLSSWVARIPAVRDDLQLSTGSVGLVILGLSIGSIAGLTMANPIVTWLGAGRAMGAALVVAGAGLAIVGAGSVSSPAVVVVGLFVFGFGQGSCDVIMNLEGALVEREIGRTMLPLMHASFSLGTVTGAVAGAAASKLGIPVLWHLGAVAVLLVVVMPIAARFVARRAVPEAPSMTWKDKTRSAIRAWIEARVLLIGIVMLGMSFAEGSASDWLALASVDGHGLTNTAGAIVFGVFVSAMTIGRIAGGPLIDKFGRVPVLRVSAATAMVGLAAFIFSPWPAVAVAAVVPWGLGTALGFPVGMSAAADDPQKAAARVSAVATMGYLAFLAGPPLIGLIGAHIGLLNALILVLALVVAAGLAAPAARRPESLKA